MDHKEFLSKAGKKGGASKSKKKIIAGRKNIKIAQSKRWPKNEDSK